MNLFNCSIPKLIKTIIDEKEKSSKLLYKARNNPVCQYKDL
jgi:hypothetical protein